MKKLLPLICFLAFFHMTTAFAAKVTSLYQAELPVTAQTDDEREQAVEQGFVQVLMKLSGDPDIAKNPVIKAAIKRASYYVQEYSYATPSTSAAQYIIQIRYDVKEINALLKESSTPYWGENRPLILAWVATTNEQDNTDIIGSDSSDDLLDMMKQQGKNDGLPLIFPVMDVEDMNKVSPTDVTSVAMPALEAASERYQPDALLIGTIEQTKNLIDSQWQLVLGDDQWTYSVSGKTTNEVVTNLLNQVSQTLAKHYVVKVTNTPKQWLKLEVTNVTEREDLALLVQYLKQLTPVQQVQLVQVSGDVVELAVLIRGSLASFQQNAAIGKHLQFKSQDTEDNKLLYDWVH